MQSKPYVFTILTKEDPGYFRLLASAKKHGWDLHTHFVSGYPEDRSCYDKFISEKHLEILKVLWKVKPKSFLYLDGWDTIFIAPPPFGWRPDHLCFSGQEECWPEKGYAPYFPKDGPFPYLNSGVIWGPTQAYSVRCPRASGLDQLMWQREYLREEKMYPMNIDSRAQFALTLFGYWNAGDFSHLGDGLWRYNPTNSFPSIVHAAGKSRMPDFL